MPISDTTRSKEGERGEPIHFDPKWQLIAYLWICYALNHADRQVVYALFPVLQETFGYSDAVLGLTGSLFVWIYGLSSPIAGILGDRWPKRNLVMGSLVVWSSLTLLSGLAPNGTSLLICRALLGVAESMFFPSAYAMIAAAHGHSTGSRAVAVFGTSHVVGVAFGGTLSGFVAEHLHWRASFWMLGALGLLFALPLSRFFRRTQFGLNSTAVHSDRANAWGFVGLLRIPTLAFVILYLAFSSFALYLVSSWLPTFLGDRFRIGLAASAFGASVYPQLGSALGLFAGGFIADRYNQHLPPIRFYMLVAALCGAAPCLYLLGNSETVSSALAAAFAFGFFSGFGIVNQSLAAFQVVPLSRRASAIGLLNLVGSAVSGLAPLLGGVARRALGLGSLISLSGLVNLGVGVVVLVGIFRYFHRDHARVREQKLN